MLFHKIATLDETHTFINSFAKCCTLSPTTSLFRRCTISPITTIFKGWIVSYSATLHKVLPIFEFKIQTTYCYTSQLFPISEFKN